MRIIPPATRAALEQPQSPTALLAFLTIDHVNLQKPIRAVSDVFDYVWGGETFAGIPFEFVMVRDDDAPPTTQLRVQNVDRMLGEALRSMTGRARVSVDVLASSDFDLTAVPRVEVGEATSIYAMRRFELIDVTVTAIDVTGTVMLRDYSQEPYPGLRATMARCPGLYR